MKKNYLFQHCFLIFILFSIISFSAQTLTPCNNEDFEASGASGIITNSTSIAGWTAFKFLTSAPPVPDNCVAFTSTSVPKINPVSVQVFTSNGYVDPIIGMGYTINSVFGSGQPNGGVSPGLTNMYGNNFVKVGDVTNISYNHHGIEKTINVTASNSLFRFAFIPVVSKGTLCCQSPALQIHFYNASSGNTVLPCPVFSIAPTNAACINTDTASLIATATSTDVYYHPWKIVSVDLSPYIGSNITFKLGVFYCSTGCLKYSYAYLDAQCGPMQVTVNGTAFPAHTNSVNFSGCGIQSATVVAPPDFSAYQWSGPGNFTSTLSTITTSSSGTYTLNIFTSGTCSAITKYVNIQLLPNPTVNIVSSNTLLCKGKTATLTASGLNSYTWSVAGNGPKLFVAPANTTTYLVSGHNAQGCFGSSSLTQSVISCVGVESESVTEKNIRVYPNPANGEFIVELGNDAGNKWLCLKNSLGENVFSQTLKAGQNFIRPKLLKGIYYCEITEDNKQVFSGKIIME